MVRAMPKRRAPNIRPGEVLLEEFLGPLGISQNALAHAAAVPPHRINEIVLGKRGVTAGRRTMIWKRRGAPLAMTSSGSGGSQRRMLLTRSEPLADAVRNGL